MNLKAVISADMRGGNDTPRAGWPDFSARNRGPACVHPVSKKWLRHFFDSLSGARLCRAPFFIDTNCALGLK